MITEITPYGLTVKGAQLLAKVHARGIKLEFAGVGIGDGYLPDDQQFIVFGNSKLINIDSLVNEIPTRTTAES